MVLKQVLERTIVWNTVSRFARRFRSRNNVIQCLNGILYFRSGFSPVNAGLYQGYIQLSGVIPALILPLLQKVFGSNRQLSNLSVLSTFLALVGFTFIPQWSAIWSICFGFGVTLGFIVGLAFISLRAESLHEAAALSGMAQLSGYLLAAAAPVLIGALFDVVGEWQMPLNLLIGICIVWAVLGWYASPQSPHVPREVTAS